MTSGRHRRRLAASTVSECALLLTCLLVGGGSPVAAASSPEAPSGLSGPALLYAMQSTLCAGGSAHTSEVQNWSDGSTETTSTDLTESGGRQVMTLDGPAYDAPERVTLLSVKGVVYAKGDSNAWWTCWA